MVFFVCNSCGESVKKVSVEKHKFKCHTRISEGLSCMDCGQNFGIDTYARHLSCITEAVKYGAARDSSKEAKKVMEKEKWIERIKQLIKNSTSIEPELKNAIKSLVRKFGTAIPQKPKKFENFITNGKFYNQSMCAEIWAVIGEVSSKAEKCDGVPSQTTPSRDVNDDDSSTTRKKNNKKKGIAEDDNDEQTKKRKSRGGGEGEEAIDDGLTPLKKKKQHRQEEDDNNKRANKRKSAGGDNREKEEVMDNSLVQTKKKKKKNKEDNMMVEDNDDNNDKQTKKKSVGGGKSEETNEDGLALTKKKKKIRKR